MTHPHHTPVTLVAIALGVVSCTSENVSYVRGYCDDAGCYRCTSEEQCSPVPVVQCDGEGACEPGFTCTNLGCVPGCSDEVEGACGEDARCVDGYCTPHGFGSARPLDPPQSCVSDEQCSAETFCDDRGLCVERCKSDDQCPPGEGCLPCGKCHPKGEPATCGAAPDFCSEAVSCGGGKVCVEGRCHLACETGGPCPVGQVCAEGRCVDDPLPAQPECALDLQCDGGSCINGYCHALCSGSTECPGVGTHCQMGVCQPDYHPAQQ
jgi:hypothetical protein